MGGCTWLHPLRGPSGSCIQQGPGGRSQPAPPGPCRVPLDGLQVCEETPAAKQQGKSFLGSPAGARVPRGTGGGGTFGEVSSPPRQPGAWLFPWRVTRAGRWVCGFFFWEGKEGRHSGTVATLATQPPVRRWWHAREGGCKARCCFHSSGSRGAKNPPPAPLSARVWWEAEGPAVLQGARSSSWPRWRRCG